ncbi:FIG00792170: hypothetical protein [hydrothermal vent metagenome]|uniref:Lipo-like protein n=1 Tax=hydrothermal vent metagenome TaxID=652676 RepID=A0A3B0TD48_9ZZZZ
MTETRLLRGPLDRFGLWLARVLSREIDKPPDIGYSDPEALAAALRPGDVLLIEGRQRLSTAIKYLTQSTWSHSALFAGDALPPPKVGGEGPQLIEVNLGEGCVVSPLSKYRYTNARICRPVGLSDKDRDAVVGFMAERIGYAYDMKNIVDLARYLLPTPPVPVRFRRRMLALGSGDPTRAICSTMIAQAFQSVRYPILPVVMRDGERQPQASGYSKRDILHIRHHSLFVPRDFDLSPYFSVVKPTVENGFDYRDLNWAAPETELAR